MVGGIFPSVGDKQICGWWGGLPHPPSRENLQVTFNLTYYPFFKAVKKLLKELHLLLTPDQAHKRVFSEVTIIGFKNVKSLKNHWVRATLPQLDREGRSKPYEGANHSFEVCDSVKDTMKFKKPESKETFDILKGLWIVIRTMWYIFLTAKKCLFKFPYVGSTVTNLWFRFNNYKITHRKFRMKLKKGIIQKILKSELKQCSMNIIFQMGMRVLQTGAPP